MIKALRETGELDNTQIVFLIDNGANPEDCSRYGSGFDRPGETRSGEKIIYPVNKEVLWANVANMPYRFASVSYEGGMRTPMIVFWPKRIAAKGCMWARQVM